MQWSWLTLWLLNLPKQASSKSAVFPELAITGQITIGYSIVLTKLTFMIQLQFPVFLLAKKQFPLSTGHLHFNLLILLIFLFNQFFYKLRNKGRW